ncbi:MAG: cytochrome c maturation protein CcmE [Proteobacteria bacterium]|nr:cytochrome c maturation protein CcmE [Pseudomonadota bacterium]MBU1612708.1 cytochrome c maturation protein CcmE [Pseudomonadota bacterium]
MAKKNSKSIYIVALVLLLAGLGYLITSGLSEGSTPTLQISTALDMPAGDLLRVRLYGKVLPQDIAPHEDSLGVTFTVADQQNRDRTMRVDYSGAVPDTFNEDVEVIVKGSFDSAANVFRATQLTTKCPSKYEEKR